MSTSISSVNTASAYTPTVATAPSTSAAALSTTAVSLSGQSAVVATLGGWTAGTGMYSAAGLLDTLSQAGVDAEPVTVPTKGSDTDSSNAAQQALNQGIVSTMASSASGSGVYTGAGSVNGLSEQASANWASLLKTNPNLASTVVSASFDSGIVSSLQVTA